MCSSGNYSSDEQKEIARLRRKLHDAQDALDVLKSHRHSGKMTKIIYLEVAGKAAASRKSGHRGSVFGTLKFLGVSQSGYHEYIKARIQVIYEESRQNYGVQK